MCAVHVLYQYSILLFAYKIMENEKSLKEDFLNLMISCLFMSRFCMLMDNVKLHAVFQWVYKTATIKMQLLMFKFN
jgi:hypothetical protein